MWDETRIERVTISRGCFAFCHVDLATLYKRVYTIAYVLLEKDSAGVISAAILIAIFNYERSRDPGALGKGLRAI